MELLPALTFPPANELILQPGDGGPQSLVLFLLFLPLLLPLLRGQLHIQSHRVFDGLRPVESDEVSAFAHSGWLRCHIYAFYPIFGFVLTWVYLAQGRERILALFAKVSYILLNLFINHTIIIFPKHLLASSGNNAALHALQQHQKGSVWDPFCLCTSVQTAESTWSLHR